jgi:hypothetical protein
MNRQCGIGSSVPDRSSSAANRKGLWRIELRHSIQKIAGDARSVQKLSRSKTRIDSVIQANAKSAISAHFLRSQCPKPGPMNGLPLQFLMLVFAGWANRHQQDVIEYLREEEV